MSTATQVDPRAATQHVTTGLLDASIEMTDQRKKIIQRAAEFLGVPADKICGLLRNVWTVTQGEPPLTDHEMFSGLSMIARYQLDPIAREVYVTRNKKGRLMTIIGIDGIVKILDRTTHYDGFEQEYGWDDAGEMEWCATRIFSKTRSHPTVYKAFMKEYKQLGGFMMETIPWHQLRIFSLRHATRLFTPLGGNVVTEEEFGFMNRPDDTDTQAPPASLDALTDRMEQSTQQQPEQSKPTGNGKTTAEPEKPAESAAEETPQAESEADETRLFNEYEIAVNDAVVLNGPDGCNGIEKNVHASFRDGDLTLERHAAVLALLEAKRVEIRGGRGAGSKKPDEAKGGAK